MFFGSKHHLKMLMTTLLLPIFLYFTLLLKNCVLPSLLPPFSSPSKKIQYLSYLSSLNYELSSYAKNNNTPVYLATLWTQPENELISKICINLFPLKKNIPSDEQKSGERIFFENITTLISMLPFFKNCLKIIG